ncbi:hypothetical protein D9M68_900750 [compost metagenome]
MLAAVVLPGERMQGVGYVPCGEDVSSACPQGGVCQYSVVNGQPCRLRERNVRSDAHGHHHYISGQYLS